MKINDIIKKIYLFYTIYLLLLLKFTDLNIFDTIYSIILLWIIYVVFILGEKSKIDIKIKIIGIKVVQIYKNSIAYLLISSILFSIIVVKYYTGQSIITILNNINGNIPNYYIYQKYFAENLSNTRLIEKLPFIIMMFFVKYNLLYTIFNSNKEADKIKIIISILSYIYISISRGTSFEIFEILVIYIYHIHNKINSKNSIIKLLISILLIALSYYLFLSRILERIQELTFYKDGIKFNLRMGRNNIIGIILTSLYDYFGFGFIITNKMIKSIYSMGNSFSLLIPYGYKLILGANIREYANSLIPINARWIPDIFIMLFNFGIIATFLFIFILGNISKKLGNQNKNNNIYNKKNITNYILQYFILMQMISFPIGNFVRVSSSSILIILYCININNLFLSKIIILSNKRRLNE
jgi:hypothetical protein